MLFLPRAFRARNLFVRYLTPVALLLTLAQAAHANTFNVNSTTDILNPPAGVVTLRSAIQAANSISGGNTINLTVAGVYKITLPGANTGKNASGAFVILPGGGNLTIVNTSGGLVVVDGNKLDRVFDINPGASSSPAFTVTMQGFTITNGLAQPAGVLASGGGIRAQSVASVTLTDMIVTGNEATADGGGIAMENAVNSTWTLTINNSTISDNHAGDSGGGIDCDGTGSIVINSGTVISGNTALNQGGGIFLDLAVFAFVESANLTMQGTLVSDNKTLGGAIGAGGGICNNGNGSVNISDSVIQNNSANFGGGFADFNNLGTLTVTSSAFLNNTAVGNGGAIFEGEPTTSITFTEIDGNSSGSAGGGILAKGTTLTVQNSTFANNTASGNGGGIELQTTGSGTSASSISNSTITNNSALNNSGGNNGGGLDAPAGFTGLVKLTGVTISGNSADNGGGVFWAGANGSGMSFADTIVAKNAAFTTGPDANNPANTFTDGGGNLIGVSGAGGGNTGFTAATTQTGTSATPLDPLLGPLQNNGGPTQTLALLPGSPAIDKGIVTTFTTDQRGVPRPQGTKFDIGAFEANQGPTPSADISALSLDFGSQGKGTSSSQDLTISSNGTAALKLSNVAISGPDAGDFKFTPPSACATLPATLQPGNFCIYKVTFSPLAAGTRTAVFTFTDNHLNAPNSPQTVALSGAGIIKTNSTVSLALTTGTNPSVFGASLTFTATVTPNTATGSVTFFDGATNIGIVLVSGGTASFTTSSLTVGSHSMKAEYSGDTFDNSATSAVLTHQVLAATSTSLAASLNPSVFGQAVTFTATVTSATPGTITGTVTFKDVATTLGSGIISSGKATLLTSTLTPGVHSITAVYSGNTTYGTSTSLALSHTVNKAASKTSVSSSHNPSVFGQSVTFTANVAAVSPGSGTPAGTVTFKNGAAVLGSGTLTSGKATFTTSALTVGAHSVTAVYNGSVDYNTSTSAVLTQTVNKAASSTTLTSSPNPSTLGQTVTFKVTVATLAPGSGIPTGSVTLKDGATVLQTMSLSSGKATFTTSSLAHGAHSMTAAYSGSTNNLGSTSAVTTQTVN